MYVYMHNHLPSGLHIFRDMYIEYTYATSPAPPMADVA